MSSDRSDDHRWIQAVRLGDREAFGRLVETYQGRLFGLCLMMVRDPTGAEEVMQETLIRAFTRLELYDERRPFYPWLAKIGVRLAQTWLHRRALVEGREGTEPAPDIEPRSPLDPLGELIGEERNRRLWQEVAALPSGERTAVFLYYRQDMAVAEVAEALGVGTGTVKTMLFRARRKLRRSQNPPEDTP